MTICWSVHELNHNSEYLLTVHGLHQLHSTTSAVSAEEDLQPDSLHARGHICLVVQVKAANTLTSMFQHPLYTIVCITIDAILRANSVLSV